MKRILLLCLILIANVSAGNNRLSFSDTVSSYGKENQFLKKDRQFILATLPSESSKLWIAIDTNQTFDIYLYKQKSMKAIGGKCEHKVQDRDYNVSMDYGGIGIEGQFFSNQKGCLSIDNQYVNKESKPLTIKLKHNSSGNVSFEYQWVNYKKLQAELDKNRRLWDSMVFEYYRMETGIYTTFLKYNRYLETNVHGKRCSSFGLRGSKNVSLFQEEVLLKMLAETVEGYYEKIQNYINARKFISVKYNKIYGYPMSILVSNYPDTLHCMKKEENFEYRIKLKSINLRNEK